MSACVMAAPSPEYTAANTSLKSSRWFRPILLLDGAAMLATVSPTGNRTHVFAGLSTRRKIVRELPQVTLIGVDCVEVGRLLHAAEICQRSIRFGDVRILTSLPHDDPSIVPIDPITSIEAYSAFVVKELNTYVATPFALVIQYDGFILNPDAWRDDFLAYDYIGAPWWEDEGHIAGNGGFSLRSKRLLARLQQDEAIQVPAEEPEDWYICVTLRRYLEERGIRFAPVELAQQFALEGNEGDGVTWTNQFGFHGLRWTDISPWLRRHPGEPIDNTLDNEMLALKVKLGTVQGRVTTPAVASTGRGALGTDATCRM